MGLRRCAQRSLERQVSLFLTFKFKWLHCKEREKGSVSVAQVHAQNWHPPPSRIGAGAHTPTAHPTHPPEARTSGGLGVFLVKQHSWFPRVSEETELGEWES